MTDRSRRVRRQISDATEDFSEESDIASGEDYDPRRLDSMRRAGRHESAATSTPPSSRPRRSGASVTSSNVSSATVERGSSTSDGRRQSLKLTVKAPPSRLREVMRANEVEALQDVLGGGQVLAGPRSSRRTTLATRTPTARPAQRSRYAEYGESDIEDDDEEEEEEDDGEEEEEEQPDAPNDFDELGAEPEGDTDDDDDEDVDMEDAPLPPPPPKRIPVPKPPKITLKPPAKTDNKQLAKPKVIVTPAKVGPVQSVEDEEMEDDSDDDSDEVEDSSDLSEEDDEDEETANINDEDAEGEEEEMVLEPGILGEHEQLGEGEDDEDEEDDSEGSSDETPGSGAATPDLGKMTKRQRGRPEDEGTLMALDMAPQQRKFFTDAEKLMKKDEHARKRKELTKRKVQEEKNAALNRLLKPQVSKTRGAAPKPETLAAAAAAAGAASPYDNEDIYPRANPVYTRWVSTREGVKLGVPAEWLGKQVGRCFGPPLPPSNGALIQEIE